MDSVNNNLRSCVMVFLYFLIRRTYVKSGRTLVYQKAEFRHSHLLVQKPTIPVACTTKEKLIRTQLFNEATD